MAGDVSIVEQRRHNAWDLPIPRLADSATLRPFSKVIVSVSSGPRSVTDQMTARRSGSIG
jgi:hypothetical protein